MNRQPLNIGSSEVYNAVIYISKLFGIKNLKTEDVKFCSVWLQKNLLGVTINEVVKAAEMALNGHITANIETFGTLSPKIMAEIIQKYKIWRIEDRKQQKMKAPALPEKTISKEEKEKIIKEGLYDAFESYQQDKVMPLASYDVLFKYAWGHMPRYNGASIDKIKKEANEHFDQEYEEERGKVLAVHEMKQLIDKYKDINTKTIFRNKCKELYLRAYFDELIEKKEDIKDRYCY